VRRLVALGVAASFCFWCAGWSAEPTPESIALSRILSATATSSLATFHVKPGFRLELVTAEPLISSPVAIAFDENNRLFVVERRDETGPAGAGTHSGRVRVLEDTEGKGQFHASTVYADNLPWASAVACWSGGVFVAASPDILFLKDSRTNGVADVRRVVFTGFKSTNAPNAQTLPNNFNWGLDNRIHAATAGLAGFASGSPMPSAVSASLADTEFAFDPRSFAVIPEAGPAQSGLTFDDRGRKFVCDFMRPLRTPMYEPRYLDRNPFFPAPPEMVDVASPATAVFRFAAVEPPQLAGERPRINNVPAPIWLTNAQGCVVYRGNAFPSTCLGNVFIADPSAHVIHHVIVGEAGLGLTATRAPDEANTEFVSSSDPGFCPVQVVNGPDGALYVVDRRDGGGRGRIYRIVPTGFERPTPPRLGKGTPGGLVSMLSHPNGWQRDTVARLLYERQDPNSVLPLAKVLATSRAPLGRLHALHALDGLGALNSLHVLTALRDQDERVREHAVLLSEKLVKDGVLPDTVWNQLRLMTADASIRVRYQLALTAGELRRPARVQLLAGIPWRDPGNPWMQAAVLSSLADGARDIFVAVANDQRFRRSAAGQEWLDRLATMIGITGRTQEAAQVCEFVNQLQNEPQAAFGVLRALGDGLHCAHSSLDQVDPQNQMQPFYGQALNTVLGSFVPEPLEIAGIQLLGVTPYTFANTGDTLLLQLGSGYSEAIQAAAITTLGRYDDPRIGPGLIQRWSVLTPRLRYEACTALLARTGGVGAVLTALENGSIRRADLSSAQVNFLRTQHDPALSQRALRIFGLVPQRRPEAVQRFKPALGLKGASSRGRDTYLARCADCHTPGRAAQAIGPDLATAKIYGKEKLLTAILEPNASVRPDYPTYVVQTASGEALLGVLRNENAKAITLQQLNGVPVVLPSTGILYAQAQPWSLMPEGLEAGLTPQDMADLLEYVLWPTATP
jgi:putative membrane-bound dehydrogenase-like protein